MSEVLKQHRFLLSEGSAVNVNVAAVMKSLCFIFTFTLFHSRLEKKGFRHDSAETALISAQSRKVKSKDNM